MPADSDPATACINDDLVIDVECDGCGPANSGQPDKTYSGCIPGKVVGPCVLTRMTYGHQFAGKWLLYPGGWPFECMTPTAGNTQVVKRGLAALCCGDDVVYHHGLAAIGFSCLTISAPVVVYFNQLLAPFGGQVCAHDRAPRGLPDLRPVRLPNWAERRPGWHGAPRHHTIAELPGPRVADVSRRAPVIAG